MKQPLLFAALGLAAVGAFAQEVGTVLSSVPVVQQVAVPRQICNQAYVTGPAPTTGAGGLMGAIAGGAIGSTIGHGSGTAAAVLLGTVGGALLGNNIEAGSARQAQVVPQCVTQMTYENRTVGYDVTYEYAGREQTVRMASDPGPTVALQITPMGANPIQPPSQASGVVAAPPMTAGIPITGVVAPGYPPPAAVAYSNYPGTLDDPSYAAYPVYPAYPPFPAYRPYLPAFSLGFVFGNGGGYHHHHHRRGR